MSTHQTNLSPLLSRRVFMAAAAVAVSFIAIGLPLRISAAQSDPLPSWNDGAAKQALVSFVTRVTKAGGPDFVPEDERIAVFDNDGTLWSEQPFYFQLAFGLDKIRALAKVDPALADTEPYKSFLSGDPAALAGLGEEGVAQIVTLTHGGMTTSEFEAQVKDWLKTARHPRFDRPYTDLVFQPMLELLAYMRSVGFKTYVVSGGGIEFMRPWMADVYGIPPEQVIGSSGKTTFRAEGDKVEIRKLPEIEFVDDGPGKPIAINRFIGRLPVFAAGNSDGDLQMLQWTTLNAGPRFGMIVHHTDDEREWAYDRKSRIGRLNTALDQAGRRDWLVVDMKKDWKVIYPFQKH